MNDFDKQNPYNWKWGFIYYNPKDPSLWVEKLTGLGWTLNFARWESYIFIAIVILVPVVVAVLV